MEKIKLSLTESAGQTSLGSVVKIKIMKLNKKYFLKHKIINKWKNKKKITEKFPNVK